MAADTKPPPSTTGASTMSTTGASILPDIEASIREEVAGINAARAQRPPLPQPSRRFLDDPKPAAPVEPQPLPQLLGTLQLRIEELELRLDVRLARIERALGITT